MVLAAVLVASPPAAADDVGGGETIDIGEAPTDPEPEEGFFSSELPAQAMDAMLLRPLGAIASLCGFAMFLAAAPLVAPAREIPVAWDIFVLGPVDYTFVRPLGDF